MRNSLFAYTPERYPYPAYISVNDTGSGVEITVRAPQKDDGSEGDTAVITLPYDVYKRLLASEPG